MFRVYKKEVSAGYLSYSYLQDTELARYIGGYMNRILSRPPFFWSMNDATLLAQIGPNLSGHSVVIDLKPKDRNVSLYEVCNIFGCHGGTWAPLAFHLRTIYVDHDPSPKTPEDFKKQFTVDPGKQEDVCTFLYLRKNANGNAWNWGRVGSTNGVILWPDVLAFFCSQLRQVMRRGCPKKRGI